MVQPTPAPVDRPKLLLVEGLDDERFFGSFLRHLGIPGIQIRSYGGKNKFGGFLDLLVAETGFDGVQSIGITMDADNSAASSFQSIRDNLRNVELPAPDDLVVPTSGPLAVSAFVMPNNSDKGELETLCLAALSTDTAMKCVDDYIRCVNGRVVTRHRKQDKAKMHTFLASRDRPYLRFGEFTERSDFPWNHPAFTNLAQFLQNL